jgi:hypothetical protein
MESYRTILRLIEQARELNFILDERMQFTAALEEVRENDIA